MLSTVRGCRRVQESIRRLLLGEGDCSMGGQGVCAGQVAGAQKSGREQ